MCANGCAQADFKAEYGDLPAKSEEELNAQLGELQHRITHESVTLNEEKAALARIKKLEGAREKVGFQGFNSWRLASPASQA